MNVFGKLEEITPWRIRRYAHAKHRKYVFWQAMRAFVRNPRDSISERSSVLSDLIFGWGNEDWSAWEEYLQGCLERAFRAEGPILECGTGLSTVLLGRVAQDTRNVVWSLEHTPAWGDRVVRVLERYHIPSKYVCSRPLKDYGEFSWYDPPTDSMPDDFAMVVCDGPPGGVKGGRYGLLPVMRSRLRPGAVILLDDAQREDERAIGARWALELHTDYEVFGSEKPYIAITVPSSDIRKVDE